MKKIHIQIEENQNIWFTSDLHFGHRNVLRFCNRPFGDIKEMSECLIKNWNDTVGDNDVVFVLGDTFWFNDSRAIKKTLSQLKGKEIYLLPGNHDDFEAYHRVDDTRFILCPDVCVVWFTRDNKPIKEVWLSHYPMMTWPHRVNGSWQLFGHIHSQEGKMDGVDQDLPFHWNQIDIGCDRWGYKPISFTEIENIMICNRYE